jgi:hypothetical protein
MLTHIVFSKTIWVFKDFFSLQFMARKSEANRNSAIAPVSFEIMMMVRAIEAKA